MKVLRSGQAGALLESSDNARKERARLIRERYDFEIESDRIAYLNETLLAASLPPFDDDSEVFENPFRDLPPGTMHKLVATLLKVSEPFRQRQRLFAEAMLAQYGPGRTAEEGNPLLQGDREFGKSR